MLCRAMGGADSLFEFAMLTEQEKRQKENLDGNDQGALQGATQNEYKNISNKKNCS